MIVSGAGVAKREAYSDIYLTVMDLAPTFLELAGGTYPDDKAPMLGESAWPYFAGASNAVHDDNYVTVFTHRQYASIRQGNWKLMTLTQPFDESDFALHDLAQDPGETSDLSAAEPARRAEMLDLWRAERRRLGIVLPEDL